MTDRVTGGLMKDGALPHLPYLLHLPKPLRFHVDTEGNDATRLWEKMAFLRNSGHRCRFEDIAELPGPPFEVV